MTWFLTQPPDRIGSSDRLARRTRIRGTVIGVAHPQRSLDMNLTISGHQLDLTDSLKTYARVKLEQLIEPFDKVIDAHVILSTEKLAQYAEATVNLRGSKLFAKAEGKMCTPPSMAWSTSSIASWCATRNAPANVAARSSTISTRDW